jgi:hypothetical protein
MTIKFICTCGKHLKARDDMAARRSVCPRCGSPVGIPSLKPTHTGTVAAPLSPDERRRWAKERQPLPTPPAAAQAEKLMPRPPRAAPRLVHLLSTRKQPRPDLKGRHLEKRWSECLLYPLRTCHLCCGLALLLTVLSAAGALAGPRILEQETALSGGGPVGLALFRLTCVLLLVFVVGLPCSFLNCVLASATAGEVYYIRWSGDPVSTVLLSGGKWLLCFLAGPVVLAGTAWVYWVYCGDPGLLDWLILIELGVVCVAYWLFALLAVTDRGRLRDVNPLAVADMAHRLGWRGLAGAVPAAVLLLAHGAVLLFGIATLHTAPAAGCLLLAAGWVSGLFWSTFFCRLLGVWCYRSRKPA